MAVYFIRAGEDGPVKIGVARDVSSRLANLQSGHYEALTVLRTVDGHTDLERWYRRHYARLRIRGEWHRFDESMLTLMPTDEQVRAALMQDNQHIREAMAELIGRITAAGYSEEAFCSLAGLRWSTWCAWRRGGLPKISSWDRVTSLADQFCREAA